MRHLQLALSIAIAAIVGCTTKSNQEPIKNPFNEPSHRAPLSSDSHGSRVALSPVQHLNHVSARQTDLDSPPAYSAVSVPAADRPLEIANSSHSESPRIQEMLDEAKRLGDLGDAEGKADVLKLAGYSGSVEAFYELARMYLDGSVTKDMIEAVRYISLSHDGGFNEATRVLGMLYLRGQGVPVDEVYGSKLLEQASKTSARAAREYGLLLSNQQLPFLNNLELGLEYLRLASDRGDRDASLALSRLTGAPQTQAPEESPGVPKAASAERNDLRSIALKGDPAAMVTYAQQLLIGRVKSSEPEFKAYCWLSVAQMLGSRQATQELSMIAGVRVLSDKTNPGHMDQCISALSSEIQQN